MIAMVTEDNKENMEDTPEPPFDTYATARCPFSNGSFSR
jgi:hypothetical protein